MCKFNRTSGDTRIDPCMREIVKFINSETSYNTKMCCCGHGKYPASLIVVNTKTGVGCQQPIEIFSGRQFKYGQNRFYKRDKKGVYHIPDVK
jgi:hypothetical protein